MAESKRNLLNKDTGFNVMVNLYVIRYLFSHMEKAECFMDKNGKRKKSKDVYDILGITRQRMHRILHGEGFEMSKDNREKLKNLFDIEDEYFNKNGKMVEVHLITEEDWKFLFAVKYKVDLNVFGSSRQKAEHIEKIEKALERLLKKNVVENEYATDTAIYKIWYLWKNGVKHKEESNVDTFIRALDKLQIRDWIAIEDDLEKMEWCRGELLKHANYLRIVYEYKKVKGV